MKAFFRNHHWFPALLFCGLVLYGTFYHISSSEFWPITVSKSWWTPAEFEFSQVQKLLFSLTLAFFHLLPLDDVAHLYTVKAFFSALGLLGVFYYAKNLLLLAKAEPTRMRTALLVGAVVVLSPALLHNFFRVRSDQVTFLLAMLALYFHLKERPLRSLGCLALVPLFGIKGVLLLLPLGAILLPPYLVRLRRLPGIWKFNVSLLVFGALVWIVGLNLPALSYFLEGYTENFPHLYLKEYVLQEGLLLILAVLAAGYLFIREKAFRPYTLAALLAFALIVGSPQPYPYYISTLAPLIYLPALVLGLRKLNRSARIPIAVGGLQFLFLLFLVFRGALYPVRTNFYQFNFLNKASTFLNKHPDWKYLDGMGTLPRSDLIRCFVSPGDDGANNSCRERLTHEPRPDVVIITQRLSYLGNEVFRMTEKNYVQVLPNFWVHGKHRDAIRKEDIILDNVPAPMLIFSF